MLIGTCYFQAARYYYAASGRSGPRGFLTYAWLIPSVSAATLMAYASQAKGTPSRLAVRYLLRVYCIDVSRDARIEGPLFLPHPHGITIGIGVRVGKRVALYQNVTLGTDHASGYPVVEDDATIFVGSVVVGSLIVESGTKIAANSVVAPTRLLRGVRGGSSN